MSVAQYADFKWTGRGMAVHGREVGREGLTNNALLSEGRPRIGDHISGSSVRENNIPPGMRLSKKALYNSDKK